jgi:hypothetical protein
MRKVLAPNLESLRSGSADPDSKPWLPASQSPRKRLTNLSAMQLDVNFQAQNNTRTENNGPDNYANSRHRSDSRKGFPGRRAGSGSEQNVLQCGFRPSPKRHQVTCLLKIAYTGHVNSINGGTVPVLGAMVNRLKDDDSR